MIREEKNIIGLCGRQGSGKTMLANYLVNNLNYKRIYVAEALKELCSKILGMSIDELNNNKTIQTTYILTHEHAKLISDETNIALDIVLKELSAINFTLHTTRQAFQFIGTDLIRKYNPNWHIEKMLTRIKPNEKYVVDDVRFPNEVQALQYYGCTLIFIIRPTINNINHHLSEESLKWQDFSNLIINNRDANFTIQQLHDLLERQTNIYAEKYIAKYDNNPVLDKDDYTIEVNTVQNKLEITVFDNTIGNLIGKYNSDENPLEIEDLKFKTN